LNIREHVAERRVRRAGGRRRGGARSAAAAAAAVVGAARRAAADEEGEAARGVGASELEEELENCEPFKQVVGAPRGEQLRGGWGLWGGNGRQVVSPGGR
jgi:hypothetical protein